VAPDRCPLSSLFTVKVFAGGEKTSFALSTPLIEMHEHKGNFKEPSWR
jgi:hypothetical protein